MQCIRRGMILAAGFGVRMWPLTSTLPKPLAKLHGRPLISYALENFENAGVEHVLINLHYLGGQIQETIGNSYGKMQISYQREEEILGTGGAIGRALPFLMAENSPVLVANADVFLTLNSEELLEAQNKGFSSAILLVAPGASRQDFEWDDKGQVIKFHPAKPICGRSGMFCGYQLISQNLLSQWPTEKKVFCFMKDFYIPNLSRLKLGTCRQEPSPVDISTVEDMVKINQKMNIEA